MEKNKQSILNTAILWILFLATNLFFVCKYVPRVGGNPIVFAFLYGLLTTGFVLMYRKISARLNKNQARILSILVIIGLVGVIGLAIALIDPLSIRVDRWSATSYFLDALFKGEYPYGVFTHRGAGKFPSPFPIWHYLNIPFWLIGDVGWIQAFFLLIFSGAIYYYFHSWKSLLFVLFLLCLSPAYWWEIATRSDNLSNALLVCSCILFTERYPLRMQEKWWLLALIAGGIASTRMSAVIPLALYLFRPWLDSNWKNKVGFICIAVGVVIVAFLPYILWDTNNWIFFQRNPFITQSLQGNSWLLLCMVVVAIGIAYKKRTFYYYASTTSMFMFAFMLVSYAGLLWTYDFNIELFKSQCDISYFTLSLPYTILALTLPNSTP